jgi:hypothetical protein
MLHWTDDTVGVGKSPEKTHTFFAGILYTLSNVASNDLNRSHHIS